MPILIDTSVLGRLANRADISHPIATTAIARLHRQGEILHIAPQNLIEFRNFATRPVAANGLGLAALTAEGLAATFETAFSLLHENADIFPAWKSIVTGLGIIGKQVHDARLVAICHVNSVTHLLTFNVPHFLRISQFGPRVAVLDPGAI